MKLLFDENLSPRLVIAVTDLFPGSHHIEDCRRVPGAPGLAILRPGYPKTQRVYLEAAKHQASGRLTHPSESHLLLFDNPYPRNSGGFGQSQVERGYR